MKRKSQNPFLHIGKILLIILALPFALAGVLLWAAVLFSKAAVAALSKKHKEAGANGDKNVNAATSDRPTNFKKVRRSEA